MFLFYVLSFFKKGDTIEGGTLFKEIRYMKFAYFFFINRVLEWSQGNKRWVQILFNLASNNSVAHQTTMVSNLSKVKWPKIWFPKFFCQVFGHGFTTWYHQFLISPTVVWSQIVQNLNTAFVSMAFSWTRITLFH